MRRWRDAGDGGQPADIFSQTKQNGRTVAIGANRPSVCGINDNIDMEACNAGDPTTCPFTPGGRVGLYFPLTAATVGANTTGWSAGLLGTGRVRRTPGRRHAAALLRERPGL
jgi:hypothetical protein